MFRTVFVVDGFGRKQFVADTLAGLSAEWAAFRDSTGIGNSDVLKGGVVKGRSGEVGHMSYNGKVWSDAQTCRAKDLIYDPYA